MAYATTGSDVQRMFGSIASRYDLANSVLSFGIHHLWRRTLLALVDDKLPLNRGGQRVVCDLCTGTGDLLPLLQQKFASITLGVDFCLPMLRRGSTQKAAGFSLLQGDALRLPFADESLSLITVAFGVRNFESVDRGLAEIRRVLVPGGRLLILEFGQPPSKLFGSLYAWYSKHIMPLLGGVITGNPAAYRYLPETSKRFPCGEKFTAIVESAGFAVKKCVPVTFGIGYCYSAQK